VLLALETAYYWAKITHRKWNDDRAVWLYDLRYHDGDVATDLTAHDMFSMEETVQALLMNPTSGVAQLPVGWISPFMLTEEKEEMLGHEKYVYAARRQRRGSKAGKNCCCLS
jgi:hypothetical protein